MKRPKPCELITDPGHLIAFGFGSGLSPWAPGTMGSLAAIPLYLGLARTCLPDMLLWVIVAAFAVGVPICNRTGHWLGEPDHPGIVWDEVVAMWVILYTVPPSWLWYTAALCLFRLSTSPSRGRSESWINVSRTALASCWTICLPLSMPWYSWPPPGFLSGTLGTSERLFKNGRFDN